MGPFSSTVVVADAQEMEDISLRGRSKYLESSKIMRDAFMGIIPYGQISLATDDMWRRHRRITTPVMSSKYLKGVTPRISSNAQELIKYWSAKMAIVKENGGKCFSCTGDFESAALGTITEVITGAPVDAIAHAMSCLQTSPEKPTIDEFGGASFPHVPLLSVHASLQYLFTRVGDFLLMPPLICRAYQKVVPLIPSFRRAYREVIGCECERRKAYRKARELGEEWESQCMIDIVMQKEDVSADEALSGEELRDEVITFLFAVRVWKRAMTHEETVLTGRRLSSIFSGSGYNGYGASMEVRSLHSPLPPVPPDVRANALFSGVVSMKFLSDNPEAQYKLRAELLSALDDSPDKRPLTFADVNTPEKTPYLEAVVNEVLRLGRVAEGFRRITTEPIEILGHHIPRGTDVTFISGICGENTTKGANDRLRALDSVRSESSLKFGLGKPLWEDDAKEFKPERWLMEVDGKIRFNPKAGFCVPFGLGLRACAGKQLAVLGLKIYIAMLNLAFFFEKTPPELASYKAFVRVTRVPAQAFVAPRPWSTIELTTMGNE
ncbi:hypothetical protein FRB99_007172 [Tulasnella sp. 403]|nr:hypothetical protein FRB99_007172 [Tulasnella sp. 403]